MYTTVHPDTGVLHMDKCTVDKCTVILASKFNATQNVTPSGYHINPFQNSHQAYPLYTETQLV